MVVYARSFAPFQYRHLAILQTAKYSEPEASYPKSKIFIHRDSLHVNLIPTFSLKK